MVSKKVIKYMKQYREKYAPKERKLEKSNLRQYSNRSESWQTSETSSSDCDEQSGKKQEEIELVCKTTILNDAWVVNLLSTQAEEVAEILEETYHVPPKKKRAKKT